MKKLIILLVIVCTTLYAKRTFIIPNETIEVYNEKDSLIGTYKNAEIIHYTINGYVDKAICVADSVDNHITNILFPSFYTLIEIKK